MKRMLLVPAVAALLAACSSTPPPGTPGASGAGADILITDLDVSEDGARALLSGTAGGGDRRSWLLSLDQPGEAARPVSQGNAWIGEFLADGRSFLWFRPEPDAAGEPEEGTLLLKDAEGRDRAIARLFPEARASRETTWDLSSPDAGFGRSTTVPAVRDWLARAAPGDPPAIVVPLAEGSGTLRAAHGPLEGGGLAILDRSAARVHVFGPGGAGHRALDLPVEGDAAWLRVRGGSVYVDLHSLPEPGKVDAIEILLLGPGEGEFRPACRAALPRSRPEISPGGRWVAWAEARGEKEGVVVLCDTTGAVAQRDLAPPAQAAWAGWFPRSDRLAFVDPSDGKIKVLDPATGETSWGWAEALPSRIAEDESRVVVLEDTEEAAAVIVREIGGSSMRVAFRGPAGHGSPSEAISPAGRWFLGGRANTRFFVNLDTGFERPGFDLGDARTVDGEPYRDFVRWLRGERLLYTKGRREAYLHDPDAGTSRRVFP